MSAIAGSRGKSSLAGSASLSLQVRASARRRPLPTVRPCLQNSRRWRWETGPPIIKLPSNDQQPANEASPTDTERGAEASTSPVDPRAAAQVPQLRSNQFAGHTAETQDRPRAATGLQVSCWRVKVGEDIPKTKDTLAGKST